MFFFVSVFWTLFWTNCVKRFYCVLNNQVFTSILNAHISGYLTQFSSSPFLLESKRRKKKRSWRTVTDVKCNSFLLYFSALLFCLLFFVFIVIFSSDLCLSSFFISYLCPFYFSVFSFVFRLCSYFFPLRAYVFPVFISYLCPSYLSLQLLKQMKSFSWMEPVRRRLVDL